MLRPRTVSLRPHSDQPDNPWIMRRAMPLNRTSIRRLARFVFTQTRKPSWLRSRCRHEHAPLGAILFLTALLSPSPNSQPPLAAPTEPSSLLSLLSPPPETSALTLGICENNLFRSGCMVA